MLEYNNIEYSIPLNVKLVFAKDCDGDLVVITPKSAGFADLKQALIAGKPTDRAKTHPYLQKGAINKIHNQYHNIDLSEYLVFCKNGQYTINSHCFQAVVSKNKWKNSNNKYHYKHESPSLHYYSDDFINEFVKKIMSHKGYLENAKKSYEKTRVK